MSEARKADADGGGDWAEQLFGPSPFSKDDPLYSHWVLAAGMMTEADERLKARVLKASVEGQGNFHAWVFEFLCGRFEILACALHTNVNSYRGAALLKEGLAEASDRTLAWLRSAKLPDYVRRTDLVADVRLRLLQRSSFWYAEALNAARSAHDALKTHTSGTDPLMLEPGEQQTGSPPVHVAPTPFGRNVDRLRRECGWSFDDLSKASEIDKRSILRHVNQGTGAYPSTVKAYADAFSERLGRAITADDLNK